jgi:hypothetical protein
MLILNADISHNSSDWLMWLTIESKRTKKELSLEKRCWFKLEHHSVIGSYLELYTLDLGLVYMDGKLRHRPKISMRVQNSIFLFWSPNISIKRKVWIYLTTQTLFSIQSISRVLEVQISSFFFWWKAETDSYNFHETTLPNSDCSNTISSRKKNPYLNYKIH